MSSIFGKPLEVSDTLPLLVSIAQAAPKTGRKGEEEECHTVPMARGMVLTKKSPVTPLTV